VGYEGLKDDMTTASSELRFTCLARGITKDETIFFPLAMTVAEDGSAVYSACVLGMEDRIIATGRTVDDATHEALELFKSIVDTALDQNLPLSKVLGPMQFQRLDVPITKAGGVFRALTELIGRALDATGHDDDGQWEQVQVPAGMMPQHSHA
jgi:hypothetical protein